MSGLLTFYTNPMSRGRIVRWMLEEIGCSYETVLLDYDTTMKNEEYLAVNPMGKVPAIRHGELVVTEASAICLYLADAFPEAGLAPPVDSPLRGTYYRWMLFAAGPLDAAITAKSLGLLAPEEGRKMASYGSFDDTINTLEAAVAAADPYLCGDQFTCADLYVGATIGWGTRIGIIPSRPAFEPYLQRVTARPSYARASALDDPSTTKQVDG